MTDGHLDIDNLPQKRISPSFQLVISTKEPSTDEISNSDKQKVISSLSESIQNKTLEILKPEPFGIGRGAGGGGWGFDFTSALSAISDSATISIIVAQIVKRLHKAFDKKRRIVYYSKFLEHYCIGKILEKIKESSLNTVLFKDITGGNHEEYEYIDYYLFLFSGQNGFYLVLVDATANIIDCKLITNYQGVKSLKF